MLLLLLLLPPPWRKRGRMLQAGTMALHRCMLLQLQAVDTGVMTVCAVLRKLWSIQAWYQQAYT
jgi:hypothetical protein